MKTFIRQYCKDHLKERTDWWIHYFQNYHKLLEHAIFEKELTGLCHMNTCSSLATHEVVFSYGELPVTKG